MFRPFLLFTFLLMFYGIFGCFFCINIRLDLFIIRGFILYFSLTLSLSFCLIFNNKLLT